MSCMAHFSLYGFCLEYIYKVCDFIEHKFPIFHLVFFDRKKQWRFSRYTLRYIFGIFLAVVFWNFIIYDLGISTDLLYTALIVFIIILGLGYTFSREMRCIMLLTCIGFLGKSGRSFLRAIMYTLIISGPIKNMADNGRETIRVFSCSALLTYNLTKTRFDLMTRPFYNAIAGLKKNVTTVKDNFKNIQAVVGPIVDEIEESDVNIPSRSNTSEFTKSSQIRSTNDQIFTAEYYQQGYTKKIEERCDVQLKKGEMKCKRAFTEAYEKCYEKLPALINTLFCWPMKVTVICNIKMYTFGTQRICDSTEAIDEKLGENYYNLKLTKNMFAENLDSVSLKYEVLSPRKIPGVKNIEETRNELTTRFAQNKTTFDYFMQIVKRILAFIFLKVIVSAINYHRQYVNNIDADNIYITNYFKKIDKRRKENGKCSLLPLKKIESREIIDPTNYRQSKSETKSMFVHILKLLLELISALLFLLIDHIIYVLLEIVHKNARIEYRQTGEYVLNIHVNGTGIIGHLIRATLKGFNTNETIHVKLSNELCLPRPSHLPITFNLKFTLLYLLLTFLICNQRIIFRLRHVICSFFYSKQEKRRVLHLYNKLLKRRKQIFATMQEVVRAEVETHRIQNRLNVFVTLRMKCPSLFGWLRLCTAGRRLCLTCHELEPRKFDPSRPHNFANCKTRDCFFTFCEDCWFDIGEQCLACAMKKQKSLSPISEVNF